MSTFDRFRDHFQPQILFLERNYRSTANIVATSNLLISQARGRFEKTAWTANPPGNPVIFVECRIPSCERRFVADAIASLVKSRRCSYRNVAILYRRNKTAEAFVAELRRVGIPVETREQETWDKAKLESVVALLTLLADRAANHAYKRVVRAMRLGLSAACAKEVACAARMQACSLFSAASRLSKSGAASASSATSGMTSKDRTKLAKFTTGVSRLSRRVQELRLSELVDRSIKLLSIGHGSPKMVIAIRMEAEQFAADYAASSERVVSGISGTTGTAAKLSSVSKRQRLLRFVDALQEDTDRLLGPAKPQRPDLGGSSRASSSSSSSSSSSTPSTEPVRPDAVFMGTVSYGF